MIEFIDRSEKQAVIDVLGAAFAEHPMLRARGRARRARLMIRAMLDAFDRAPDAAWLGEKRDGRWACIAFVFEDGAEPPWWEMPRMLWRMVRIAGLGRTWRMRRLMSEKHEGSDRRLHLMLLGTDPALHKQGLGRAMLRHVNEYARERGYDAVVLEVAKHTPAFGLYTSEGYALQKEVELPEMPLCWMRQPVAEKKR